MKNKLLAVIFGATLVLGACGGGDKASDSGTDGSTAGVDADKVFQSSCATCHGGNLEGRGNAPALANIGSELSEDEIHDIIENGTSNGMPGGLIQGEELDAVAKWLSEKK
ncbi:cytochrome c-551 [Sporosarcina luteola]|uniref:Cytochrome c-551 n=1 Tax=Sporosarcina luteola TaxID=582850 RepID=A0A511Z690_9BACL|nr:cytochrome c [Sporosarcina luteola]GEN82963.1 cytochrome c-551 [Sporosarcina luteola]